MKRAVAAEPVPLVCECCGEEPDNGLLSQRHPPSGLRCCAVCVQLTGTEMAIAYGRRLRKAAERPR